jgi:hypothetical protein
MLIDKKIINPIRYHQDNPNTVLGQASTMKALFDQGAEDLRVKLNGVIDELLATTGASNIGIDPAKGLGNTLADALTNIKNYMNLGASGITANVIGTGSGATVQSQLEWLLLQIQNILLNQIPDGTITIDKLALTLANTINDNSSDIGILEDLTTTNKTNLVSATNEVNAQLAQDAQDLVNHKTTSVSSPSGAHGFDVKSGSWNATVRGGDTAGIATYAVRDCTYYRAGNLVLVRFVLNVTITGAAGNIEITDLPFTPKESPCVGVIGYASINGVVTDIATCASLGVPQSFRLLKSNKQYVVDSEVNTKSLTLMGQITYET